jgi:hypothetical protein
MPANDPPLSFPVRGEPGGWHDPWDEPDDHAELRNHAEIDECRTVARALLLGRMWRQEMTQDNAGGDQRGEVGMWRPQGFS